MVAERQPQQIDARIGIARSRIGCVLVSKQQAGFMLSIQVGTEPYIAGKEELAAEGLAAKLRFADIHRMHAEVGKPSAQIALIQIHSIRGTEGYKSSSITAAFEPASCDIQCTWQPETRRPAAHPVSQRDARLIHPTELLHRV